MKEDHGIGGVVTERKKVPTYRVLYGIQRSLDSWRVEEGGAGEKSKQNRCIIKIHTDFLLWYRVKKKSAAGREDFS